MSNFPPEYCPYCGTKLEVIEWPKYYQCSSCDEWVFHNAVLGGGVIVVDGDRLLLVEDFRESGTWKVPEGRAEIPESPREGAARELEEETGLSVDPQSLVYLYDDAKEVVKDQFMMSIYYAVDRDDTSGTVEAGSDATDARFWSAAEFDTSDQELKEMPNPTETRSWDIGLDVLRDLSYQALQRETRYATLFAPHIES